MLGHEEEHEYTTGGPAREWRTGWRRISWGAIFAGAFVTMAVFLMLQLLGAGIGLSAIDLTGREVTSPRSLGIGAAIWYLIITLISLFIGGWAAGRLAWLPTKIDRLLHGLSVWAVFYTAMFLLTVTALSALMGGGLALLGGTASAAGQVAATSPEARQTAQQALPSGISGISANTIQQEVAKVMGPGAAQQNPQANENVAAAVNDYLKGPKTPQDRQQVVQTITQNTGMNEAQANQLLTNLERSSQQVKKTGEQAANVTGATLIGLAITMFLGAIAALLGSWAAPAPRYVPAYELEPEKVRTGAGTYSSR